MKISVSRKLMCARDSPTIEKAETEDRETFPRRNEILSISQRGGQRHIESL